MRLRAFSIFDRKTLQYHPPFFASTNGGAVRSLGDLVCDPNTQVGRHPNDFVLYCVGEYDDQKGEMIAFAPLEHVVDAIALAPVQADIPFPPGAPKGALNGHVENLKAGDK